jgi:diguanylate cyclase (GGDEF)-like protein
MRRLLERIFEEFTPNARVLVAVGAATPFLLIYFVGHGLALRDETIRQGLHAGPVLGLQAMFLLCSAVNVGIGVRLWPRRWVNEPADDTTQLACLSIGLAYTLLCMLTGTFTSGTNLILVGVLAIGLLLFELRPMVVAYLVCAILIIGQDALVLAGWIPYAPALSDGVFEGGRPVWWFDWWRQYVLYAGWTVMIGLLLFLLARLDHLHENLTRLSYTDGLTGLANRRRFMDVLASELARQARSGSQLCLLLIDADHFKDVNDRHGHHAGDAVLRQLAGILMATVRTPTDLPARLGGEEFAVVLPDTRLDEARRVAERLREQVATHVFEDRDQRLRVTVSIGLVSARDVGLEALLQQADLALYRAKETGRNRVVDAEWLRHG